MKREAITPVVGVILMVAITVVLAAIVYLWVVSFIPGGKQTPVMSSTVSGAAEPYRFRVDIRNGETGANAMRYYVMKGGETVASGTVGDIYSKNVDGIKFVDNNADNKISVNDLFLIERYVKGQDIRGGSLVLKYVPNDQISLEASLA